MIQGKFTHLPNDLALFETYPDNTGIKRYFVYDIRIDNIAELTKTEYYEYRQEGAWTNLVIDEAYIKYIIDVCKTAESKRIQVKEALNGKTDY